MSKYVFIINPAAGNFRTDHLKDQILSSVPDYFSSPEIIQTESPGHATEITRRIINDKSTEYLISGGGDGTINEIVNGFDVDTDVKVGMLPIGSGNDFVKNLNYPQKTKEVVQFLFSDRFTTSQIRPGIIEYSDSSLQFVKKRFINAVGIGFDGYVAYLNQREKRLPGMTSYLLTVLTALKNRKKLSVDIDMDGNIFQKECLLLTIGNGICSGGGFYLNPFADPLKEKLDLTTVNYCSIGKILKSLPMALVNKMDKVDEADFYEFENIKLKLDLPYFVHADGEILSDKVKEIHIRRNNHKINFIRG